MVTAELTLAPFAPGAVWSNPSPFTKNTAQANDRARRPEWRRAAFLGPKAGAVFFRVAETGPGANGARVIESPIPVRVNTSVYRD